MLQLLHPEKFNIPLAEKVLDHVLTHPELHLQAAVGAHDCNTPGCIMGWAAVLNGRKSGGATPSDLGVTYDEYQRIFMEPHNDVAIEELRDWIEQAKAAQYVQADWVLNDSLQETHYHYRQQGADSRMNNTKDILAGALALMQNGDKWGKHDFKDRFGNLCAQGAIIEYVTDGNWSGNTLDAWDYVNGGGPVAEAINVLADYVGGGCGWVSVGGYNNSRRSFEEIQEWFQTAIDAQEELTPA